MNSLKQYFSIGVVGLLLASAAVVANAAGASTPPSTSSQCALASPSAAGGTPNPNLPASIQTAISAGSANFIENHCPPDPATILSYTCASGDNFCTTEETDWTTFLTSYGASPTMSTFNYGNQTTPTTGTAATGTPSAGVNYGF